VLLFELFGEILVKYFLAEMLGVMQLFTTFANVFTLIEGKHES